jgi:hypothetical protein
VLGHGVKVELRYLIDARAPVLVTRVLLRVDAICGAGSDTRGVFGPDAGFGDDVMPWATSPISFHGMPVRAEIQAPGQCRALFAGLCEQWQTCNANSACDRSRIFREGEVMDFAGIGEEAVRQKEVCVAGLGRAAAVRWVARIQRERLAKIAGRGR